MTYALEKVATVAVAATIPAAGFAGHAQAAAIKAGLVLKNGFPGAEPVNGMFMPVLGMFIDPVAASGA